MSPMTKMVDIPTPQELTEPVTERTDEGYREWKERKIRAALDQSKDRSTMTPAEIVWERFGFER
jgi:hypothetical protein